MRQRQFGLHGVAIIPLGPGSLRDSSSLPEGRSASFFRMQRLRAGPALPSYLALLHAGFSVPRMLPSGRWALTPPFHPYQVHSTERGGPSVFPQACRRGASITGGLFSEALSVATPQDLLSRVPKRNPLALPGALPDGVRTFLPPTLHPHFPRFRANRRSPNSPAMNHYSLSPLRAVTSDGGNENRTNID